MSGSSVSELSIYAYETLDTIRIGAQRNPRVADAKGREGKRTSGRGKTTENKTTTFREENHLQWEKRSQLTARLLLWNLDLIGTKTCLLIFFNLI